MALPQDGQDANGLTKVTQIPAGKELMFIDPTTNEGGIITLEDLTKQILNGLTSQTFGLDSGTQTLPAAINYLYGNTTPIISWKSPSDNIIVPANSFFDFEIDISIPGYEAMGVIGRQMNAPNCYTLKESISRGTNLNITIMNTTASSIYIKPAFLIIYYKNRI